MDTLLVILAGIAIVAGILGSFLPFLPGPPLAWAGLLMLHFSSRAEFTTTFLVITAIITIVITALDYLLPIWTAKRSGGTKYGQRGATVGMILGLFAGPLGIIIGPLVGAFVGELVHDSFDWAKAKRAAWNSFIGFLLSTGLQLGWCLVILFWYVRELF
ncbi:MAG TPA: DUF456 domain-containing protein [Flavipsychrobacter sp.]|nr:DUF456 domain-containing protein [Flavipsychrobacter sp.]